MTAVGADAGAQAIFTSRSYPVGRTPRRAAIDAEDLAAEGFARGPLPFFARDLAEHRNTTFRARPWGASADRPDDRIRAVLKGL